MEAEKLSSQKIILSSQRSEMVALDEESKGKIGLLKPISATTNHSILLERTLMSAKSTTIPADETITDGRCGSTEHD